MRKIVIFLIVVMALFYFGKVNLVYFNEKFDGDYSVYSTENIGKKFYAVDGKLVFKGNSTDTVKSKSIEGETITLYGTKNDIKDIMRELFVIFHKSETIDNIYIVYAYSPRLKRAFFANGILQNLQITLRGNVITISNPINLGSF